MKTQLDMFSPLYYSTLGYDEELIDYLTFIEDDIIRELQCDGLTACSTLKYYILDLSVLVRKEVQKDK